LSSPDVLSAILTQARGGPEREAVKDLERELTYADLCHEVAQVAAGLRGRGVTEGDRVALHLPNSVDFVVAALGCLSLGAIFVPLAVSDPTARLEIIIGDCGPTLIVTHDAADAGGAASALPSGPGRPPAVAFSELPSKGAEPLDVPAVVDSASDRGAYIIYTSGTTGTPNGVLIGRAAFAAAVSATSSALGLGRDTRTLCVSPFHFDGSFATLFPTLRSGGTVVIRPRDALLFPRTFFRVVAAEAITYTGFSPSYGRLLLSNPLMESLARTPLRLIALGGEASSAADVRSLWEAAPEVVVYNRYGPTETTIAVTHMKLSPDVLADGTVPMGQPHPGVTFHLVDEQGALVEAADQVGELYVGGTQLMTGYWGAPALTASVLRDDLVPGETLYRTGDLAYRNPSGDYVYVDRVDRVINRNGVRISLVELTDTLRDLDGVMAAACLTFDDEGQLGIVAFAVTDGSPTALDLRRAARERLPDTMLPNRIDLVETLPLTSGSKLDERGLLAAAGLVAFRPEPGAIGS
jgi:D-alanine--poly(phosphoribitol) ligase subunit 1